MAEKIRSSEIKRKIGSLIKERRSALRPKVSQAELSFRAGLYERTSKNYNRAQQKMRKIEDGTQDINVDEITKIAEILEIPQILKVILGAEPPTLVPSSIPSSVPWEIKELYNRLRKDIDACRGTETEMWKVINQLRAELEGLRKVLRDYATTGDTTSLKKLGGKRK
jgi:hypothetical protein